MVLNYEHKNPQQQTNTTKQPPPPQIPLPPPQKKEHQQFVIKNIVFDSFTFWNLHVHTYFLCLRIF